jgi:hypothetical protein
MVKMPEPRVDRLHHDVVITLDELWLRCFALGTMNSVAELEAFLRGEASPTRHEYNLIAVALNEHCSEYGAAQPVPYIEDEPVMTTRSLGPAAALASHPSPARVRSG